MNKLFNLIKVATISAFCFGLAIPVTADDTEIYQASFNASSSTSRPKVLIIFDNSGSMVSNSISSQLADYDPTVTYADQGFDATRLYWDLDDTDRYIAVDSNRCNSSITPLSTVGQFQGKAQVWRLENDRLSTLTWEALSDSNSRSRRSLSQNTTAMDCENDETLNDQANPGSPAQADGYPSESPGPYVANDKLISWGNTDYIFYTANYLNYYHDPGNTITKTRFDIAKDVVTNIVASNPAIDFGLMVFNRNDSGTNNDGGRVIKHLKTNMTTTERSDLVTMVNNLTESRFTPLCESAYEAYRYLTGNPVEFGLLQNAADSPNRDMAAETGALYNSPTTDCAYTYVILMTDGAPTNDAEADARVQALTGHNCTGSGGSCLPDITEFMANNDLDGDSTNGSQFGITYTIGFTTNQTLLEEAAIKGKGEYFTADNSTELAAAFQGAISSILATDESFTSPAVAVDTFSRTESRNEVFFAMFKPSGTIDWPGNIKRLNLVIGADGVAILKDKNGVPAFDNSTGRIADTATTVWSTSADGGDVLAGGVGGLLASRNLLSNPRVIYSNTAASGALSDIDNTYANRAVSGYADDAALFSAFNVADQTTLTEMIDWVRGFDVDDDNNDLSVTDTRAWIMADMLHSRPLVVNYGARGSFTEAAPDQRIFAGTNGGLFHMFGVDDGEEDWAFFPKELAPILSLRRIDAPSTQHVYGIDSPPSTYLYDRNGDGTLDSTDGDKAYIYFGLRRGGKTIYALDISDPDSPLYLWKIDQSSSGFSELGQTWSVPVVTKIPGYTYDHDGSALTPQIPKPVLVFGAGYDTNKDATTLATSDSMGRGIFIVDAFTGALVWSVTPAVNSATNLQETGLTHSVPATITPLDSNGDGISDRLYFGDTGGNVWRVDLPGLLNNARPDSSQLGWFITKLAAFNGGTTSTDRRFFASPDVVRTKNTVCTTYNVDGICTVTNVIKFDAVLIGSGDRTNPNATDVNNQFYMIRDERLEPYTTPAQTPTQCADQLISAADPAITTIAYDFRCALNSGAGFGTGDLYNATDNLIQTGTTGEIATATASLNAAHGWLLDLQAASGEKSLSRAITLYGSVFFTTFAPDSGLIVSCTPLAGEGRLYQVDLINASAKRDFNNDGTLDRTTLLGSLIPDTPSPHFGSDKKVRLLFPSGGGLLSGNPLDTGAKMPQPYGIYWYREE